jgi:hypothetical protein
MDRKMLWDPEDVVALVFNPRMSRNDRQGCARVDLVDMLKPLITPNVSYNLIFIYLACINWVLTRSRVMPTNAYCK